MFSVKDNVLKLLDDIKNETLKANRDVNSVSLCAVSKTKPIQSIEDALLSSSLVKNIGENYVQEIESKFLPSSKFSKENRKFTLRLIGHLQTNKVKSILNYVDTIDSVDSLHLLNKINEETLKNGKSIDILFELNTAHDGEKTGFISDDELLKAMDNIEEKKGIVVKGFMTMGALNGSEKDVRESFAHLREFKERVQKEHPLLNLSTLSMGMSSDWVWAIKEGSTMVRIGTSIFGKRE